MAKRPAPTRTHNGTPGLTVDYEGAPAVDPTVNVAALVEAMAKTASMLREADIKFNDAQYCHLKEIGVLRAANAETLRTSDLDRLAKTREVDVTTGAAQAATIATAVQTLATTSDKNAETLRNQLNSDRTALAKLVADTAAALSTQNDSLMKDVNNRIAELQKSSYQGAGKSSMADPQMERLSAMVEHIAKAQAESAGHNKFSEPRDVETAVEVRKLAALLAEQAGKGRGASDMIGWIFGGVAAIAALGMFLAVMLQG